MLLQTSDISLRTPDPDGPCFFPPDMKHGLFLRSSQPYHQIQHGHRQAPPLLRGLDRSWNPAEGHGPGALRVGGGRGAHAPGLPAAAPLVQVPELLAFEVRDGPGRASGAMGSERRPERSCSRQSARFHGVLRHGGTHPPPPRPDHSSLPDTSGHGGGHRPAEEPDVYFLLGWL